jgi:hypothetical protein
MTEPGLRKHLIVAVTGNHLMGLEALRYFKACAFCRLRRAMIHAELRPARSMMGQRKVQTRTQKTREPNEEASVSPSGARVGPSLKRWRFDDDPRPKQVPIIK